MALTLAHDNDMDHTECAGAETVHSGFITSFERSSITCHHLFILALTSMTTRGRHRWLYYIVVVSRGKA